MSSTETADELDALAALEPAFGRAIERWGRPAPFRHRAVGRGERFASLSRSIINQQLSSKAAATIHGRVVEALGGELTPERVLAVDPGTLRAAGMSGAKVRALTGIASAVTSGEIDLEGLDDLSDDDAYQALLVLPGVGPWTAQVFLMFSLRRGDVLAAADIGVLNGIKLIFDLDQRPTPRELAAMAEAWQPHRTAACRMAWHVASATPIAVPA
jgi:DNA-3-methyladenine glycosylase II